MNTRSAATMALACLLPFAASCQPQETATAEELETPVAQETEEGAIAALREAWAAAYNEGDAAGVAALYAEDAVRMRPDEPAVMGKDAIEAAFREDFEQFSEAFSGGVRVNLVGTETHVGDVLAADRGTYTVTGTLTESGEEYVETGKYVVVCRKQADGSWKIAWGIGNRDAPLEGEGS